MKQWYVIQVQVGSEEIVKADISKRIEELGLGDHFGEVLIPSARVRQFFSPEEAEEDQQLFPGYILIEMESVPEAVRMVMATPRVVRFLGGINPVPLSKREIERILAQMRGEVVISAEKSNFEIGKEVEIREGAFAGFVGIIDSIDEEDEKLTVMVSIFGRMTPVELSFDQVKR
ncbi:TPA: transcription termination/antitermination factor NusG [Candidatus Dependentiae bacterium]|nr:MAG: Transcription antitermination protein nusG [candidate division TM6 bacterium GW2011_GWF2_43_87]HBL98422.1 transcription termination/antitermination factor NusG [Candidatus Dependentiae bacterium]